MQRRGPAESNHCAVGQFLTAFDRVHSGGVGHVLFHDFDNTECGAERVQAEPFADTLRQCPFSGISVEPHSAARSRRNLPIAKSASVTVACSPPRL